MSVTHSPEPVAEAAYHKRPGAEPLPGYVLLEPLGRGGYGEVWKCEAPGGLLKAIKFVASGDGQTRDESLLRQEYEAFQQVKAIRHPFLLCLERVELVDGELVMVMGLADRHIGDRFNECLTQGLPGIPRDELLGYLREAAEALDVIGVQYGLQHLDVKPANLFLTAGHLQVGDYGLVSKLDGGTEGDKNRGLTPKYAAPEVLRGHVHTRSDQYSLALVYCELRTGAFPFTGRSAQQMMMQHVSVPPDLSALAEAERRPVGVALAKTPDDRYPSCRDFIDAVARTRASSSRLSTISTLGPRPTASGGIAAPTPRPMPPLTNPPTLRPFANDSTKQVSGTSPFGPPRLVGVSRPFSPSGVRAAHVASPLIADDDCIPLVAAAPPAGVLLTKILPVHAVAQLRGEPAPAPLVTSDQVADAALAAAGFDPDIHVPPDTVQRDADGGWACQFASTIDFRMAMMKLAVVREEFRLATAEVVSERQVVFRELAPATGLFGFGKKVPCGFEVAVVFLEPGGREPAVRVRGTLFGKPPPEFVRMAEVAVVRILDAIRKQLCNVAERRRRHARVPADFPLSLFPLHSDGRVDAPVAARAVNVSAGGLALRAVHFPPCRYLFVAFETVPGVEDVAVLVTTIRRKELADGVFLTGSYRLEE